MTDGCDDMGEAMGLLLFDDSGDGEGTEGRGADTAAPRGETGKRRYDRNGDR
jgi:hypothetical protein